MQAMSKWYTALDSISPFVYKILTPNGHGTGFQISYNEKKSICGIATAYHVVEHAFEWEEPIKILHYNSKKSIVLKATQRVIIPYSNQDLAFILFSQGDIPIASNLPDLVPEKTRLKQGVELGWCGFPAVAPNELCFFSGYVSCYLAGSKSYLVDGVAINGVSGGPAFYISSNENIRIGGVISAYLPNTATGQVLPGVSFVSSIDPYQEMLKSFKSLGEAEKESVKQTEDILPSPSKNENKDVESKSKQSKKKSKSNKKGD